MNGSRECLSTLLCFILVLLCLFSGRRCCRPCVMHMACSQSICFWGTPHGTLCIYYNTTFTYHISPTCHTCRSRKMPNASGHILYRNLIARNMRNVVGVYICITSKAFLAYKTYMHNTYSTPKQSFKNPWACTGTTCSYTKCFTHSKDTYCFLPHIL